MKKFLFIPLTLFFLGMLVGSAWLTFPQRTAQASFSISVPAITGTTTLVPLVVYDLKASGFVPGDKLALTLGTKALGAGVVNAQGAFTFTVRIPTTIVRGSYTVTVRNQAGVTATYVSTLAPGLATSVAYGYPGSLIRVEGFGFTPVETVTIILNNSADCLTAVYVFGQSRTNSGGGFSYNATVPLTATAGVTYSVAASGITSALCAIAP